MNKLFHSIAFIFISTLFGCSDGVNINSNNKSKTAVPESLFGTKLGGIYDLGEPENGNLGNLPIEKFTGIQTLLGSGIHYYFKPKLHSDFFSYKETPKNPNDKYFPTSFRMYLFPVIPDNIKTLQQLKTTKLKYEVSLIEWSDKLKKDSDGYYWAVDTCKTFAAQITDVSPSISDSYASHMYLCEFKSGEQQLAIHSIGNLVLFKLEYTKVIWDMKNDSVDKKIRKLQANEILN